MILSGTTFAGSKILVVEDDPNAIGILEPILLAKGLTVFTAYDGIEGLEKVKAHLPDIILLDIHMPRMGGIEVCRVLKNESSYRMIPVIMLTATTDLESKIQALEAGAEDFLNKPYNPLELLTRVKSLLRIKQLHEDLDCAEDVLFTMARAIEAKDAYTQGHVERVGELSMRLGRFIGLPDRDLDSLKKGGILHDIGKIGVPDEILNKAGALSPGEREIIKLHPAQGAKICEKLKTIRGAIPIIRHHHEKMDGSGYPDNLKGDAIPLGARIMTVADIYDALTTTRSYRKSLTTETALEMMWDEAQKGWWDKDILTQLTTMVRRDKEIKPLDTSAALSA